MEKRWKRLKKGPRSRSPPSLRKIEEMPVWNYVVTAHKPTIVTHSCVCYFTSPQELNLIIAKCTRIEIHLHTPQGLKLMLDVPIYGRILTLELFRPHGEAQDFLFITTERYKYFVLQWDANMSELITRESGHVPESTIIPEESGQIAIIDPDCRLIGLYFDEEFFKVIPFDNVGMLKEAFDIRLEDFLLVQDIKFLYGCSKPTIVVLYKFIYMGQSKVEDYCSVTTYEVALEDKSFVKGPWFWENVGNGNLLIPVPPPLCGVIVIGERTIVYCSASAFKKIRITWSKINAYGRFYADGYLLGDIDGLLRKLVITHEEEKVTGLKIVLLGETSIASTISYLDKGFVYIGSKYGDSQLIYLQPDAEGSYMKVLERYVNLGPIADFCVVDLEKQGQGQVVTCSGNSKDGSLRVVQNGIGINELASVELQGIKGMWSLRSTDDIFLVVSFISETRILVINDEKELEETEIGGFCSHMHTLFCHDAVYNQLVQVTSSSVRLVSYTSRELRNEWNAPSGHSITVATANATQVLLATGGGHLFYLKIGGGVLTEVKHAQLEYAISCLDINPIEEKIPNSSQLAAVGTWTDISVWILSLPDLNLITKEPLGGEIISRSVLLCVFEGISYLLCALGDGHLLNFLLNTSTGELTDRKKVSLGTRPITLQIFSSKNTTHVFVASDRPTVIYSNNKRLLYTTVKLKEVSHMCPFRSAAFPDSLAIAKEGELTIGTIDDIQKFHIRSILLGEHAFRICHQEQSSTFAICSKKYIRSSIEDLKQDYIHLLDDQTFELISTFELRTNEFANTILSCSLMSRFRDGSNVYYCVGTKYLLAGEIYTIQGRILVFIVEDRKLRLIAETETEKVVYSLNAFDGKLLAGFHKKIELYTLLWDDDTFELQSECEHHREITARYVQTRNNLIVIGSEIHPISLLTYKKGAIEERARDYDNNWISAVEILDDDIYLGADENFRLFTVQKNSEGATDEERGRLEVVGEYHLGECINRFQNGSLFKGLPDSDMGQIPTVIFATQNGVIGVIASLPHEQYLFLEKLQSNLRKVITGVGRLSHVEWRSLNDRRETVDARNFLDGDLIELFLHLRRSEMDKISEGMNVSVEELRNRVEELTRLY